MARIRLLRKPGITYESGQDRDVARRIDGAINSHRLFSGWTGRVALAIVLAAAMNFTSYWWSDKIVLSIYGARELTEIQSPELFWIVREPLRVHCARLSRGAGKSRCPPATAHLFIINPFKEGGLAQLFSTHAPTAARVERLEAMARRFELQGVPSVG